MTGGAAVTGASDAVWTGARSAAGTTLGGASLTTKVRTGIGLIGSVEPGRGAGIAAVASLCAGGAVGAIAVGVSVIVTGVLAAEASRGFAVVSAGGSDFGAAATLVAVCLTAASTMWPSISERMRASR